METLWRELHVAIRSLSKTTSISVAVIATLAIGIGATSAIFSIVNGVLLKPLAYPDAEQLISLRYAAPGFNSNDVLSAPFLYFTYREHAETFEGSGIWNNRTSTVTGIGEPARVRTIDATAAILPLLGIEPAVGRVFSEEDDLPGAPLTTVLTYGFWQRYFAGDRRAVGQLLTLDGRAHEIIGVMPQGFRFLDEQAEVFRPLQLDRAQVFLGNFSFGGIARLRPGTTMEMASADARRMIPIAMDSFPPFGGGSRDAFRGIGLAPNFRSLKTDVIGDVGGTLWLLLGTIGIVLLIACANVANLLLIRAEGRVGELSVRAALGAGRLQIARPLLMESLLFAVAGGLGGLALAAVGLEFVLTQGPAGLPRIDEIEIDRTVVAFAVIVSALTGLVFGSMPALRSSSSRFTRVLSSAGRGMTGTRDGQRARSALVVVQVALALILMIGAGLLFRTYVALNGVEPGFTRAEEVQTFGLTVSAGEIAEPREALRAMTDMANRIEAIPGVDSVAFASSVPLEGSRAADVLSVEGVAYDDNGLAPARRLKFVSPGYFATLGIPLVAGRDLEWIDLDDRRLVTIVSESLANEEWGSPEAALGERVRTAENDPWREIVGVVGDVHEDGLDQTPVPIAYFPVLMDRFWNVPVLVWRSVTFSVRSRRAGTEALVTELRSAGSTVNGNLPLANFRTLGDLYKQSLSRTSFTLALLGIAGVMALFLSLVGIYAVIAYAVSQRTREIGIRLALGASSIGVQYLFARQALGLIALGAVAGLAAAGGLTRLMQSSLYGVTALDIRTFAAVTVLLLPIALLASFVPARRALRVDPMDALRDE